MKTASLEEIFTLAKFLQDAFKNQFLTQEQDLDLEKTKELLEHAHDLKMVDISDLERISVSPDKKMRVKIVQLKDLI